MWVHNMGRRTCWDADEVSLNPDLRLRDADGNLVRLDDGRYVYEVEIDGETRIVYRGHDGRVYERDQVPPTLLDPPANHVWVRNPDGSRSLRRIDANESPRMVVNEDGTGFIPYVGPERLLNSSKN